MTVRTPIYRTTGCSQRTANYIATPFKRVFWMHNTCSWAWKSGFHCVYFAVCIAPARLSKRNEWAYTHHTSNMRDGRKTCGWSEVNFWHMLKVPIHSHHHISSSVHSPRFIMRRWAVLKCGSVVGRGANSTMSGSRQSTKNKRKCGLTLLPINVKLALRSASHTLFKCARAEGIWWYIDGYFR